MNFIHERLPVNGIELHIARCGEGPLVVLCHGFPGLWYSWRHQLPAIADAGFTAVAYDQRGYGRSSRPVDASAYDSDTHCADLLGLLDALGHEQAIFVGHDFGAPLVWNMAVRHPEKCIAIVPVSCPYDFDLAGRGGAGANPPAGVHYPRAFALPDVKPTDCFAAIAKHQFIHLHYFQAIGPADAELAGNPREFLMRIYWALSAMGNLLGWEKFPSEGTGYLDVLAPAPALPWSWMAAADFDYLVQEYQYAGKEDAFIGGLNNYRVADRNWELGAIYADRYVDVPTLFVSGAQDPVLQMVGTDAMDIMREKVRGLRGIVLIPEAGHFVQMEQADAFNNALLEFIRECGSSHLP